MRGQNGEKLLFSADHVMSWSSSIVSPPNGDMRPISPACAYFSSATTTSICRARAAAAQPHDLVRGLLTHRLMREAAIADALGDTPIDSRSLVDRFTQGSMPACTPPPSAMSSRTFSS